MIVAALTVIYLLFGGGGVGHHLINSDKAIKKVVDNKALRGEILSITKQLAKDLKQENKLFVEAGRGLLELPQDYETPPETFDAQIELIMSHQQQLINTTLDAREQMRKRMTAEQWHSVFKKQTDD